MRKLIITEFVSLDGVMEAPGGEPGYAHTGWVGDRFSDGLAQFNLEAHLAADTLLLGRLTYESFRDAWPSREGPMADKINAVPKVVVSSTLGPQDWAPTAVIPDASPARIGALKEQDGGPILVIGSRTLAQSLLAAGLVDELCLQVFPLILGSGARLFGDSPDLLDLELVESRALPRGVLVQTYRPAAA